MSRPAMFALLVLGPGCSGGGKPLGGADRTDGVDSGDLFSYGELGTYDPSFQPLTWSFLSADDSGGDFQVSITNRDGLTDCGLGGDFDAMPATPAQQIIVAFRDSNYSECPQGLFTVGACDHSNQDVLGSECARFREWDADGQALADLNASSGAMRVTDEGNRCTIELELNFPGGSFVDQASIPYIDTVAGPFCNQ